MKNGYSLYDQTIAFSGLLQACFLVDQLARTGSTSAVHIRPLIYSLFQFNPRKTRDVYHDISKLDLGFTIFLGLLDRDIHNVRKDVIECAIRVLHLEKKVSSNGELLAIIHSRLADIASKYQCFEYESDLVISRVSDLYQDTFSNLKYRINVSGKKEFLVQARIVEQVRTLLFSAFRSAFLWRQVGGSRWHFIFKRGQYRNQVLDLIQFYAQDLPRE